MENILYTAIGSTGAGIILVLFVLNQLEKIDRDSFFYDIWNFIGALLLVVYSVLIEAYPFAILNAVWVVVSLKDSIQYITERG